MPTTTEKRAAALATTLNTLPSYCEVTIHMEIPPHSTRLMLRDLPTFDPAIKRRATNLDSGMEWFLTTETLDRVSAIAIEFTKAQGAVAL